MSTTGVHDFLGIGLGPFNLGLACLTEPIDDLDGLFLEADREFSWHPGMLLEDATLQVPFLADLVTMADPTSRWSFLNHLKQSGRLYPFYIRENFYPLRREYDAYCRWAADQLGNIRFGQRVTSVVRDGDAYAATTAAGETHRARALVLGVGTGPRIPDALRPVLPGPEVAQPAAARAIHSADYLAHRDRLQRCRRITIVGSGQSAAEIYRDLLLAAPEHDYELVWLTRSPRFFPMEYTKLTLEMTSPEYAAHFGSLPSEVRDRLGREQRHLYKGISGDLIDEISDLHYQQRVNGDGPRTTLVSNAEVTGSARTVAGYTLDLHHTETGEDFGLSTDGLVLATGYGASVPDFLEPVHEEIRWDSRGRYDVGVDYAVAGEPGGPRIFVQNAEEHTHSVLAPDLGMGAYRNSVIIAALCGREVYPIEKRVAVQTFGVPDAWKKENSR